MTAQEIEIKNLKRDLSASESTCEQLAQHIEIIKANLQKAYREIYTTQVYPMHTKGLPKGDDILKKYFPELKA